MKRVYQLMAVLLMALLIHPMPSVAGDLDGLRAVCGCCPDLPCGGCDCVTESEKDVPVPFAAEPATSFSIEFIPVYEGDDLSVPHWRHEARAVRSGSLPASSAGRYCGRSCVLRL